MADVKKTRPFVEQRRKTILDIVQKNGRASVADLAAMLEISPLTVRRDLDWLENDGQIYRRYGEAVLAEGAALANSSASSFEKQKDAIAKAAAELVQDEDLIFINTSSTALMMVQHIDAVGTTIITNSMKAAELPCPPDGQLLVTGGTVRATRGVLYGDFALNNVRNITAVMSFTGCAGFSTLGGVTSTTQQEAMVNSAMVDHSEKLIVLADSSKLGVTAGFTYAPLHNVDLLITDKGASDSEVEELLEWGVREIRRV